MVVMDGLPQLLDRLLQEQVEAVVHIILWEGLEALDKVGLAVALLVLIKPH
jgi:hypothetical protein